LTLEELDPTLIRRYVFDELWSKTDQNIHTTCRDLDVDHLCRLFFEIDRVLDDYHDPRDLVRLPLKPETAVKDGEYFEGLQKAFREGASIIYTNESGHFEFAVSLDDGYWLCSKPTFSEAQEYCRTNAIKYDLRDPYHKVIENNPSEAEAIGRFLNR
jgi:hypothetical protein